MGLHFSGWAVREPWKGMGPGLSYLTSPSSSSQGWKQLLSLPAPQYIGSGLSWGRTPRWHDVALSAARPWVWGREPASGHSLKSRAPVPRGTWVAASNSSLIGNESIFLPPKESIDQALRPRVLLAHPDSLHREVKT